MKRWIVLAAAVALAGCTTSAMSVNSPNSNWVGAWGASPAPPMPDSKSFENQTVRQVVRLSAAGERLRVRLTNEYGEAPLEVGAITVSLAGSDGAPVGAPVPLTFGGQSSTSIPRFSPMLSDPVALPVKALDQIVINLYLPKATGRCTCHVRGLATTQISGPGDFTRSGFVAADTFVQRAFLSAVEVETAAPTRTIVTFGDSITDGTASTVDGNKRWTDVLAERLSVGKKNRSVYNAGISGNRLLSFGQAAQGEAAISRFDRDVLSAPNASWMTLLIGINDIGMGGESRPSAEVIIAGYRQIIDRAHAHGLKIYGATLLPYEGARYYSQSGEAVRQAVNAWIRSSGAFDAVIDFDALMKDPANPKRMKADLASPDWLHPNDTGYKVMGDSIDLALFN